MIVGKATFGIKRAAHILKQKHLRANAANDTHHFLKQVIGWNVFFIQLESPAMADAGITLTRWPTTNEVNVLNALVSPIVFQQSQINIREIVNIGYGNDVHADTIGDVGFRRVWADFAE